MSFYMTLSAVIGKYQNETEFALRNFLTSKKGHLNEIPLNDSTEKNCIISQEKGGTCIVYPGGFEFSESHMCSLTISKELKCPVFSFVIYPDEYWSFVVYQNGIFKGLFQPFQNESMNISTNVIKELIPHVNVASIQNYIKGWKEDSSNRKAYDDDENNYSPWQFTDFMNKIGVEYPLKSATTFRGKAYDFHKSGQPLSFEEEIAVAREDGRLGQIS